MTGTINEKPNINVVVVQPPADPKRDRRLKIFWRFAELIAVLFWLYAIVKLFVFDVDVFVVSWVKPEFVWILNYKFLIFSALLAVVMLVTRSGLLALAIVFIVLYPLFVVFWKLPYFVFKKRSWLLALAIFNALIGLFQSFKRTFIAATAFLISAALILTANNRYILSVASLVILILVAITYVHAFLRAFRPSAIFQTYKKVFPAIRKSNFLKVDDSVRNLPVESMTDNQLMLRNNNLQNAVIFNRVCLLLSKNLRDYQRSGVNVASYVLSVVGLFFFVVASFALINFALYRIDPSFFQFTYSKESLFAFLYYSAGSMFYAANGLVPVEPLSQMVQLLQFLCALLLVVILITVFFALRNERYSFELDRYRGGRGASGRRTHRE